MSDSPLSLTLTPIGVAHTPFNQRLEAPRQPAASDQRGVIELYPGHNFEHALEDLELFTHIWVLFWFHENHSWRPKVLPPRSSVRRGVFATRSPYRPNPVGLSVLRLHAVRGLTLDVGNLDILDNTPVLDVKPYIPYTDIVPEASAGWLAPIDGERVVLPRDPEPGFEVGFSERAREQAEFVTLGGGPDLLALAEHVLELGPTPHAYRRIKRIEANLLQLALKDWRARFSVEGRRVLVSAFGSGYRAKQLQTDSDPGLNLHRRFTELYGHPGF